MKGGGGSLEQVVFSSGFGKKWLLIFSRGGKTYAKFRDNGKM
jgi:hypothetical protein